MNVRHYVLTRAVYPPTLWDRASNERRLRLFEGVTAASLRAQTYRDWSWAVMIHPADPLRIERARIVRSVAPRAILSFYDGPVTNRDDVALRSYNGWRQTLNSAIGAVLTTRIDDDDGFAPDALQRIRSASERAQTRTALVIPNGFRVWNGRYTRVRHETNAWASILSPDQDPFVIYDVRHREIRSAAPLQFVDEQRGWLWVRHADTLSGEKAADRPLTDELRAIFPVNWPLLERDTVEVALTGTKPPRGATLYR